MRTQSISSNDGQSLLVTKSLCVIAITILIFLPDSIVGISAMSGGQGKLNGSDAIFLERHFIDLAQQSLEKGNTSEAANVLLLSEILGITANTELKSFDVDLKQMYNLLAEGKAPQAIEKINEIDKSLESLQVVTVNSTNPSSAIFDNTTESGVLLNRTMNETLQ